MSAHSSADRGRTKDNFFPYMSYVGLWSAETALVSNEIVGMCSQF